jgi:hypothetical protein
MNLLTYVLVILNVIAFIGLIHSIRQLFINLIHTNNEKNKSKILDPNCLKQKERQIT